MPAPETQPLIPAPGTQATSTSSKPHRSTYISAVLLPVLLLAGVIYVLVRGEGVPRDDLGLAKYYLRSSPVIDGHIDLPEMVRWGYGNNLTGFDLNKEAPGHFDIPRARAGGLGGFFWSIFVECPKEPDSEEFVHPAFTVRDTLEQIDVSLNMIQRYDSTFKLCRTADDVMAAVTEGKIASLFGVEGAHSLGNSLGVLRVLANLGVRYMTLTHGCNNAFADSGGIFEVVKPKWGGLSPLGKELVREMNRVGIVIDLSHVSDDTALQALALTKAPVMLSHSCARHFNNISRNVPDAVLDKIGRGKRKVDGVVMVNFFPVFASSTPDTADVKTIADHITYISDRIGKHHVGIGSDFDGVESLPKGLEDVSKYPYLFAELISRGWSQADLSLLAGGNILRVLRGAEDVSRKMLREGKEPSFAVYVKRKDLDPKRTGELPF